MCIRDSPLDTACDDDKDYSRREYIEWSDTPEFDRKPDILHFSVNGSPENGCNAIYVRTNVPFTATVEFEEDEDNGEATAPAWLELVKIEHDYLPGISRLLCKAAPHPGTYKERKGCISLHTEVEYLNDFIPIVQGFPARVEGDFDWLKYGSANPLETRGETAISGWTAEQKDKGWESTPAEEEARPTVTAKTATSGWATTSDTEPTCCRPTSRKSGRTRRSWSGSTP